jgi:hypothetical protein
MSGWMTYMAVMCKKSGLWEVVSQSAFYLEYFDLKTVVFLNLLVGACICFLGAFMSFVSTFKSFCLCYVPVSEKSNQ